MLAPKSNPGFLSLFQYYYLFLQYAKSCKAGKLQVYLNVILYYISLYRCDSQTFRIY